MNYLLINLSSKPVALSINKDSHATRSSLDYKKNATTHIGCWNLNGAGDGNRTHLFGLEGRHN